MSGEFWTVRTVAPLRGRDTLESFPSKYKAKEVFWNRYDTWVKRWKGEVWLIGPDGREELYRGWE